jgi:hypothetical protein
VREKKLTPVAAAAGSGSRSLTYHDPCFLGRHNQVYAPPRELLEVIPDATLTEMPRNAERSFCCGAGGARMWMEETIGERVNVNRTREAVATGADQIAVGCPFCRVMISDGLVEEQSAGRAREEVQVLDVAQLLLASVKGEAPVAKASSPAQTPVAAEPSSADATQSEETVSKPADVGPAAGASSGGSLFDTPAPAAETKPEETKPAETKSAESGGSLFDVAPTDTTEAPKVEEKPAEEPAAQKPAEAPQAETSGGSLFDFPAPGQEAPTPSEAAQAEAVAEEKPATSEPENAPAASEAKEGGSAPAPGTEIGSGSLFDIAAPAEGQPAGDTTGEPVEAHGSDDGSDDTASEAPAGQTEEAQAEAEAKVDAAADDEPAEEPKPASSGEAHQPKTDTKIPEGGSLFDL